MEVTLEFIQALGQVLGNSHFEAWIAGPLLGGVVGVLFAGLANPPKPAGGERIQGAEALPKRQIQAEARPASPEVHHHHYYHEVSRAPNGGSPGVGLFVLSGIVLVVGLLLFAAYVPVVAGVLWSCIAAVATFCIATLFVMLLSGRYSLGEWLDHAGFPFFVAFACLYVVWLARAAIGDEVVVYAQSLLNHSPKTVVSVISAGWKFFQNVGREYLTWMLFEMGAFALVSLCTVMVFARTLHFMALVNMAPDPASGAWRTLARKTRWCARLGGALWALGFLGVAWLFASGTAFRWTRLSW